MGIREPDKRRPVAMMPDLDLDFVRDQFPAFSESSLDGFAFFENAGGSFPCGPVIEALRRYYTETKVQPYYAFAASTRAGEAMDRARRRLARWLNVTPDEIHFGPSTSQNTYVLGQSLRQCLEPGDEVIVSNQDHEANIGVWRRLEEVGAVIREWRVNPESAELEGAGLEGLLNRRTRVVAFTHCSNIVGTIHPLRAWTDRVREAGAISIVDGVSYAPHSLPDMIATGADIYLLSLYKVYGPHLGVMYMRSGLNERLPNQGHFFNAGKPNARFTPAGPDHGQIAAVNGLLDYLEAVHAHHFPAEAEGAAAAGRVNGLFRRAEQANVQPLLEFLHAQPGVRIVGQHGAGPDRAPTVSVTVTGRKPAEIAAHLAADRIGVANGNCYAWRLMEALGIVPEEGVTRFSLVHYTSPRDVAKLIRSLGKILLPAIT